MADHQMRFLDMRRNGGRHTNGPVSLSGHLASGLAGEHYRENTVLPGVANRADHVLGVAGSRESKQDIAAPPQRLHLARKNALEAEIVGARRQNRGVRSERNRRQTWAQERLCKHAYKFRCKVLRVGGAPTVAAKQQFAILSKTESDSLSGGQNIVSAPLQQALFSRDALFDMAFEPRKRVGCQHGLGGRLLHRSDVEP